MTPIYVDPSALLLPPGLSLPDDVVEPGARDALARLVEAGFDVVVLGAQDPSTGAFPAGVRRAPELPEHLDADAWYLTGDAHPSFGRPRGGTTVLVGPRRPIGTVPLPRFDLEARDMAAAAMEVLTREAMA